ncbi:hypothetical protein ACROYT_G006068 [Oculina patagonica]
MTIQYFISGKWQGYFIDNRFPGNSKSNMEITMEFQNNHQFTATGSDEVGSFTFKNGKITDGKVEFLKAYAGHNVCYEGEAKGTQMTGQWWLETAPDCKGDWAMWPATA